MRGKSQSWPMMNVGDLFDVQLGKMLNQKAKTGELYPYLANFNVRWGAFDLSKLNEMSFSEKERKKFSLKLGDLIMCEGGEIGRCAVWRNTEKEIYYQKALHRLRPKNNNANSYFYYYYMQHIAGKGELPKLVGESSIAHLTREKLLGLKVPAPPRPEQVAIVDLLSTWDEAIEKTERLIATKEKRFGSLIFSLIHKHHKNWRHKNLSSISGIRKGEQLNRTELDKNGDYPVWNGGITPSGYTDKWNAPENTITISEGGNSCGFVNYSDRKFWCGGHCYALINLSADISAEYLYFYLKSHEKRIMRLRVGSGLPNIQRKDLGKFAIHYPDKSSQKRIADTLDLAGKEIMLLKKQAEYFRSQKRGLMQKLLTEQWRVRMGKEVA